MGKTPKPLAILVLDEELYQTSTMQALKEQGHEVHERYEMTTGTYDAIIGPKCWRIDPALGDLDAQLAVLLKAVRGVKYVKKEGA